MSAPIFLIGMRGAGKTTLGKLAAKTLLVPFVDADEELEKILGQSIESFVAAQGMEAFRKKELACLEELYQLSGPVLISLGGGFVDYEPSRHLVEAGPLNAVYLDASDEILWRRLQKEPKRLVVGSVDSPQKLAALAATRRPFFKALADFFILNDSEDPSPALSELVDYIQAAWRH